MPGPVALYHLGGRLQSDFASLDRSRLRGPLRGVSVSGDMLDPEPIGGPHYQITIAPCGVAVRFRFRRPIAVSLVGRAMESLRGRDVHVERPVGFPLRVVDD